MLCGWVSLVSPLGTLALFLWLLHLLLLVHALQHFLRILLGRGGVLLLRGLRLRMWLGFILVLLGCLVLHGWARLRSLLLLDWSVQGIGADVRLLLLLLRSLDARRWQRLINVYSLVILSLFGYFTAILHVVKVPNLLYIIIVGLSVSIILQALRVSKRVDRVVGR